MLRLPSLVFSSSLSSAKLMLGFTLSALMMPSRNAFVDEPIRVAGLGVGEIARDRAQALLGGRGVVGACPAS